MALGAQACNQVVFTCPCKDKAIGTASACCMHCFRQHSFDKCAMRWQQNCPDHGTAKQADASKNNHKQMLCCHLQFLYVNMCCAFQQICASTDQPCNGEALMAAIANPFFPSCQLIGPWLKSGRTGRPDQFRVCGRNRIFRGHGDGCTDLFVCSFECCLPRSNTAVIHCFAIACSPMQAPLRTPRLYENRLVSRKSVKK